MAFMTSAHTHTNIMNAKKKCYNLSIVHNIYTYENFPFVASFQNHDNVDEWYCNKVRQLLPEIVILCSIMYELYDPSKVQNELLFVSRSKHLLCGDWKNNKKKLFHIYQNNISCFLTKKNPMQYWYWNTYNNNALIFFCISETCLG